MLKKTYIDANQLLQDSYELALAVLESPFRPDIIVGIWRGGAPVAVAMHELMTFMGVKTDHYAIRTAHYSAINATYETVTVDGLDDLTARIAEDASVLLVDDVFDTGRSLERVVTELEKRCGPRLHDIRLATPYFKPANNLTQLKPDFFLHETNEWLVFPHELDGLTLAELAAEKPGLGHLRERMVSLRKRACQQTG